MRKWTCIAVAMLLSAGLAAAGDVEFAVKRLSPRVLVLTEQSPMENIVVAIAAEKGIVVVDALPSHVAASRARDIIEEEMGRADFAYVIHTHGHWDHVMGNQAFSEATMVAHAGAVGAFTRNLDRADIMADGMEQRADRLESTMANAGPGSRQAESLASQRDFNRRNARSMRDGLALQLPELSFTDTLTLDLGDVTIELIFFGRAHSQGDILIQVPEEGLLLTGDLFLERGWLPLFAGAGELDVERWIATLAGSLDGEAPVKHVIPGHRDIWTREKLASWRDYIVDLWEAVSSGAAAGETLAVTVAHHALPERFAYLKDLDHDEAELARFHENNARAFWRQLRPSLAVLLERTIESEGLQAGLARFRALKAEGEGRAYLDEREINALGYRLLGAGRAPDAIAVFTLNVEAFPSSWNAHDSLAEALMTAGRREEAVAGYRESLRLNPDNINGQDMLKRLGAAPE